MRLSNKKSNLVKLAAGVILLLALGLAGCSTAQAAPVKPVWVTPQVSGTTISISLNDITRDKIIHFPVNMALGKENFMAYTLGDKLYVRANVCPPCRSVGFNLVGDKLVCQSCGTTFKAATGDGVSGACVAYPKAAVSFQNDGGKLVMNALDLQTAYQNTLEPGLP